MALGMSVVVMFGYVPAGASPPQGSIIYSANFANPVAKWHESGHSLVFEDHSYVITSTSYGQHLIGGPDIIRSQSSVSLRARMNASAAPQSGFGVFCLADYRKGGFGISFLVHRNGTWTIWQQAGTSPIRTLASGSLRLLDIIRETSVTAICDAIPNSSKLRVGLSIDGHEVSSMSEVEPGLLKPWLVGINEFDANSTRATIWAKSFVLRRLTGSNV